jgi:predicted cytidylate kinase
MTIITISGTPGSGKSTVAEILKEKIGIKYIYSGEIFRKQAEKYEMTLEEFGKYCEENSEVDKELDKKQVEILKRGNVILEGRLAGWLAYKNKIDAFKVFLDAEVDVRTKRIMKRENGDFEKRKREMIKRENSEKTRYKNYYDIDISDKSIYDMVIGTGKKKPDEIVKEIISNMS